MGSRRHTAPTRCAGRLRRRRTRAGECSAPAPCPPGSARVRSGLRDRGRLLGLLPEIDVLTTRHDRLRKALDLLEGGEELFGKARRVSGGHLSLPLVLGTGRGLQITEQAAVAYAGDLEGACGTLPKLLMEDVEEERPMKG